MLYTQGQMRDVLAIRKETFRYWREQIPRLKTKSGRVAQFTANEIIVLSVINEIESKFGIRWSAYSSAFERMFILADNTSWFLFQELAFVLADDQVKLEKLSGIGKFHSAALVVPTGPHLVMLEAALWGEQSKHSQQELPFPLATIKGKVAV